jgi:carbon storage regulator
MIGDDIVITILHIGSDQVKVGISAPPNISVHRKEVYNKIKAKDDSDVSPD